MNCQEANKISIVDYLSCQGIKLVRSSAGKAFFCAPYRNEKEPSLVVYADNHWHDYGTGQGGRLIDLLMKLHNVDAAGALGILNTGKPIPSNFSFPKQSDSSGLKVNKIKKLENRYLLEYLKSRNINPSMAARYLKEVYYQVNEKPRQQFALAFMNDKGGFEGRNKLFKFSSTPKAITTISGIGSGISIFEGFFDFLSALMFFKIRKPSKPAIILNSIHNLSQAEKSIKEAKTVSLFLDNDQAGKKAVNHIITLSKVAVDYSQVYYPNHKDFNQMLVESPI